MLSFTKKNIINLVFYYQVRVNKASAHQKNLDVGANIFIGNLDPEVTFLHPSLYLDQIHHRLTRSCYTTHFLHSG